MVKIYGVRDSFMGVEEEFKDLIYGSNKTGQPEIDFIRCKYSDKTLIGIVRGKTEFGGNRVYKISDYKLISFLKLYAEDTNSIISFYVVNKRI